jgi:hypothetical protein
MACDKSGHSEVYRIPFFSLDSSSQQAMMQRVTAGAIGAGALAAGAAIGLSSTPTSNAANVVSTREHVIAMEKRLKVLESKLADVSPKPAYVTVRLATSEILLFVTRSRLVGDSDSRSSWQTSAKAA